MDKLSRRKFLKISGIAGSALGLAGVAGAGYQAGKDYSSYTGWEKYTHGGGQFFNRKPFYTDKPASYEIVGPTCRIARLEQLFYRLGTIYPLMHKGRDGSPPKWEPEMGVDAIPDDNLKKYFKTHPGSLDEFLETREAGKTQHKNWDKYKKKYALADAWSNAHAATMSHFPKAPEGPPEESDFKNVNADKLDFKSPEHASELLKKISHSFGATLVGIAAVNPDWIYQGRLRGVGNEDYDPPKHWKYAIVVATPHEWDTLYANPTYGTSYDGYSREKIIAGKLELFIKDLGYSARSHVPGNSYDMAMVPLAIDAGMGELGRNCVLITPELGANARLAAVTTDLELEPDKPIDFGVKQFCEKCKICAEQCPSGALSMDEKPADVIRGYKRWNSDQDKCFKIWNTVATSHARGCRICLSVCPYSRKNNWIHTIAREVDPRDPTGITSSALLAMQKRLFEYPEANEYLPPPDGENKTFHEPPDWLITEIWTD